MTIQQTNYSLRRRLLTWATLLLIVFLSLIGLVINSAFKQSVLNNAENSLKTQVYSLLGNAQVKIDESGILQVSLPKALVEQRLMQIDSGMYAQISEVQTSDVQSSRIVWQSNSLDQTALPELPSQLGQFVFQEDNTWRGVYTMNLQVVWETPQGDKKIIFQVAENKQPYRDRLAGYQRQLFIGLSVLGLVLLVLQLGLLSWLLKPLSKIQQQVKKIEKGEKQRFDEDYPQEVSQLTQRLNQLLEHDAQRIEQQKMMLGNLAHSIKTPLAVLRGLSFSEKDKDIAEQQLHSMQQQIDYQLHSAANVMPPQFAKPIKVKQPTQQIIDSLNKLYQDRQLTIQVDIQDGAQFFGEQGDYMEVVGNVLDNAYKWAQSSVKINIEQTPGDTRPVLHIRIYDDGSGIADEQKTNITQRGVRLDSTETTGHGLGLHIVKNIVENYQGKIAISNNMPQGSLFELWFY